MKKYIENMVLELQLFAIAETRTTGEMETSAISGLEASTNAALAPELKEFYSKDLIELVGPNLIHAQFGDQVTIPKGHERKIEWRKFSKFSKALTPLTEGVTPAPHSLSVSTVTKELEQYGDYSVLTDILELTAIDPVIVEYTARHAENANLTLDTIVRNDINTGGFVRYAPHTTTTTGDTESTKRADLDATSLLTVELVAKCATDLMRMNAPKINGSYVAIVHPSVAHDIMRDDEWIDFSEYAGSTQIFNGEIGKIYGVRFVVSTEAKIFGKDTTIPTLTYSALVDSHKEQVKLIPSAAVAANALKGQTIQVTTGNVTEDLVVTANEASTEAVSPATGYTEMTVTFEKAPAVDMTSGSTFAVLGNTSVNVYSCLFLGKGAYKVTSIEGGNMEVIVKNKGSAGSADPLNQRSTVGWKVNGYGAAITIPEYILRCEVTSSFQSADAAN